MLADYYRARATHYDGLYQYAAWRDDLAWLKAWLIERVRGRTVLEVAAGTGHWTEVAAAGAAAVTATDLNPETLAFASRRPYRGRVALLAADAFSLPDFPDRFEVGMAHLWWSHVETGRRREFLAHLASRLEPGGVVLMIDQRPTAPFCHPASRWDAEGNRYERRTLPGGAVFEIIKNYPEPGELVEQLREFCVRTVVTPLHYFWALEAHLEQGAR
jgi:SAM-dependent methyltransferase